MCVKRCSKIYLYWVKKKDLFWLLFLEQKEIRDNDNEIRFEGGGRYRNVKLQCFSIYAMLALFRFKILAVTFWFDDGVVRAWSSDMYVFSRLHPAIGCHSTVAANETVAFEVAVGH